LGERLVESHWSVERYDSIELLAPEWDELADRVSSPPWVRPGWFSAWWAAFGRGMLRVLAVRDGRRLVGVVPFARTRLGRVSSPTNWHTPEFGLLAEPAATGSLARVLFADRPESVSLAFVDVSSQAMAGVRQAAGEKGYRCLSRSLERSPYILIDGDWELYEAGRSRKLLSELGRRRRRLADEGQFSFECVDGSERLDELLDEGFRVEAAGWKGARHSAIMSKVETDRFYRAVARWAAEHGWLRLAFLRLDGRPFAFDFCVEHDGVHYLLKTGFDPAYTRFAPGMILRYEMIARAFSVGLSSYEFLGGDATWKLRWADTTRERGVLQAFARSPRGLIDWAANAYGRPLARRALGRA
jgi:CelD/BcsL family acetyltransferase involved in cellulose biosynthesis